MTHRLTDRTRGENGQSLLRVVLQPQNFSELLAIKNVMMQSASPEEAALIENYLTTEASEGLTVLETTPTQGYFMVRVGAQSPE